MPSNISGRTARQKRISKETILSGPLVLTNDLVSAGATSPLINRMLCLFFGHRVSFQGHLEAKSAVGLHNPSQYQTT